MTKTKLFATAAVMSALMATPVLAQTSQRQRDSGMSQTDSQQSRKQIRNSGIRSQARMSARTDEMTARNDLGWDNGWDNRRGDSGFAPFDAAAGIAGGAVATAGAIASAPFGGQTYAYDNAGYNNAAYDGDYFNDGIIRGNGVFRGYGYRDSYASVNDYPRVGAFASQPYTNPYANNRVARTGGWYGQRSEFVCTPGSVFTNENGVRTLCQ